HDSPAPDVDQGVGSAEVDGHITAQKGQRVAHVERKPSRMVRPVDPYCCTSDAPWHCHASFIGQRTAASVRYGIPFANAPPPLMVPGSGGCARTTNLSPHRTRSCTSPL